MAAPKNKPAEQPEQGTVSETPPAPETPQTPAEQPGQVPPAAADQTPADQPAEPDPELTPEAEPETVSVRMRIKVSGTRNGQDWPNPGETLNVPEGEAVSLIANGYATWPDEEETATAETATVETATTTGRRSIKASLDKGDGGS